MNSSDFITLTLYLLALINPVSKIFILTDIARSTDAKGFARICVESTLIAFLILSLLSVGGNFILAEIFHVSITAFRIAGGLIVFYVGARALLQGVFFDKGVHDRYAEESIVPLASPMIAGPGTITASITATSEFGALFTILAVTAALALNLMIMLLTKKIINPMLKFNIAGALVRITGLIVAAIGTQIFIDGMSCWLKGIGK